ncbi:ethanolamine ammonia-lyase light chain [Panacagrimonas perspica]|uniref:Ethanolamine ammonia-lyase small subunit n=1 Tax=Panacagrimonas perspica TaxID=381431 RepID=A0A4S3K1A8_9GAMM|nr:ethanolamine ammonia-lyase subunit EutC [Panacagrimonas perspica]TDU30817.1 ethanolamine ammonia-lyase light chain [Panacagrimonas perspica]THD01628.1 hypothetical protein B1810_19175 [Panacagrimonas perspica]
MSDQKKPLAVPVPGVIEPSPAWAELAGLTPARVALGRSGVSLPTREVMSFGVAHARARDAVHAELDVAKLREELAADGWTAIEVTSAATTRTAFLARPDWGRRLDDESNKKLAAIPREKPDLVFVLSDGLSALALHSHASRLLRTLKPKLADLRVAPIVIATQARVALSDEVGQFLGAGIAVSLIGERPGLSTPDSLGAYLTADPRVGRSDAQRNCISNIHGAGLSYETAAAQIEALIRTAHASGVSGVTLAKRLAAPRESP